jgi:hypothetical protein
MMSLIHRDMLYRYDKLENPETEIRVAVVLPGSFEDEIHICFRTSRLKKGELSNTQVRYYSRSSSDFNLI